MGRSVVVDAHRGQVDAERVLHRAPDTVVQPDAVVAGPFDEIVRRSVDDTAPWSDDRRNRMTRRRVSSGVPAPDAAGRDHVDLPRTCGRSGCRRTRGRPSDARGERPCRACARRVDEPRHRSVSDVIGLPLGDVVGGADTKHAARGAGSGRVSRTIPITRSADLLRERHPHRRAPSAACRA